MALLVPPPPVAPPPAPPRVFIGEEDRGRFRMRLTQVMATLVTVLVTAWLCTLGAIPAIVALAVAKHVLVAILMMGLGVDAPRVKEPGAGGAGGALG
jgi:hypothetical protein